MKQFLIAVLLVMIVITSANANTMTLRATGYFPDGYKNKRQAKIEGGKYDRHGNLLKTLQDYINGESNYVSVATDPRIIKTGTLFKIKEIPDILFLACDVGSAIKRKRIDICCDTEQDTFELPSKVTIQPIAKLKLGRNMDYFYPVAMINIIRKYITITR